MNSAGYAKLLDGIKARVHAARIRAASAVNSELVMLYWHVGREILKRQNDEGWGSKVIDRLSLDLKGEFPDVRGFSPRNLKYMREFAEKWPQEAIVQGVLAQLSWYHNIALLDKTGATDEAEWYARQAVAYGWSRNVLVHQIATGALPPSEDLEKVMLAQIDKG